MTFFQFIYQNIIRKLQIYIAYFLSSVISVMIFFVYTLFIFHPQLNHGVVIENTIQWMIAANLMIYLFVIFYVLYTIRAFLIARSKEFDILFAHGLSTRQFRKMILIENLLIGTSSILIGISCGIIVEKLFLLIGSAMIEVSSLSFYFPWQAILITVGAFSFLFAIVGVLIPFRLQKKHKILGYSQRKKDVNHPWLTYLTILAVILLCSGYYLAVTATKFTILDRFFLVVGLIVLGTYFFFTQGLIWLANRLKKVQAFYWKKTVLIVLSNTLVYLKENARHLFLVSMVFTVAFCALGTFASTHVLNKQFLLDYPVVIGYVAKNNQPSHRENLWKIKKELATKGLHYTTQEIQIKYIKVDTTGNFNMTAKPIPVISYSAYKKLAEKAGVRFREKPLGKYEAMGLLTSQLDHFPKKEIYVLDRNIKLYQTRIGKHVVIPWRLIQNQGIIISDIFFQELPDRHSEIFTGFYGIDYAKTIGIGKSLVQDGRLMPSDHKDYTMIVSGTLQQNQIRLYKMIFFIILLTTVVFFITAGSVLYFRLHTGLSAESQRFATIYKMGFSEQDWHRIITWQLGILFFFPMLIAILHSLVAFVVLQNYFVLSIAFEMACVITSFLVAHIIFFFFIRHRYIWNLKKYTKSWRTING